MKSNLVELAKELQECNGRITEKQTQIAEGQKALDADTVKRADLIAAMQQEFGPVGSSNGHTSATAVKGKKGKKKGPASTGDSGSRKTTKQHLLEIVRSKRNGMPLAPIVVAMKERQNAGEWETDSKDITTVVSQSLNALKKEEKLTMKKDETINKNVYQAVA